VTRKPKSGDVADSTSALPKLRHTITEVVVVATITAATVIVVTNVGL
jgi:hypothetical protein